MLLFPCHWSQGRRTEKYPMPLSHRLKPQGFAFVGWGCWDRLSLPAVQAQGHKPQGCSLVSCPKREDHGSEITPWGNGTGGEPLFAEALLGASALPRYPWSKRVKNGIFRRCLFQGRVGTLCFGLSWGLLCDLPHPTPWGYGHPSSP